MAFPIAMMCRVLRVSLDGGRCESSELRPSSSSWSATRFSGAASRPSNSAIQSFHALLGAAVARDPSELERRHVLRRSSLTQVVSLAELHPDPIAPPFSSKRDLTPIPSAATAHS